MTDQGEGRDRLGRRRKRFLSAQEKYEIWRQLACGETTMAEVARQWGVDPTTVLRIRQVSKRAALEALAHSRPGRRGNGEGPELAEAKAEIARLSEALKEMAVKVVLLEGKGGRWG